MVRREGKEEEREGEEAREVSVGVDMVWKRKDMCHVLQHPLSLSLPLSLPTTNLLIPVLPEHVDQSSRVSQPECQTLKVTTVTLCMGKDVYTRCRRERIGNKIATTEPIDPVFAIIITTFKSNYNFCAITSVQLYFLVC